MSTFRVDTDLLGEARQEITSLSGLCEEAYKELFEEHTRIEPMSGAGMSYRAEKIKDLSNDVKNYSARLLNISIKLDRIITSMLSREMNSESILKAGSYNAESFEQQMARFDEFCSNSKPSPAETSAEDGRIDPQLIKNAVEKLCNMYGLNDPSKVYNYITKFLDDPEATMISKYIGTMQNYNKILNALKEGDTAEFSKAVLDYSDSVIGFVTGGFERFEGLMDAADKAGLEKITTYTPIVSIFIDSIKAGIDSYDKYSADGDFSLLDQSLTGMDVGATGLVAVGLEAVGLIPVAGKPLEIALKPVAKELKISERISGACRSYGDFLYKQYIPNDPVLNEMFTNSGDVGKFFTAILAEVESISDGLIFINNPLAFFAKYGIKNAMNGYAQ